MAKIFATARHRGSTSALYGPIKELQKKGHRLTILATGSEMEAGGFKDLTEGPTYGRREPEDGEHATLLGGYDLLLSGLSGRNTHDGRFIRAANSLGIRSLAINDTNQNYIERLGESIEGLPGTIALMDEQSLITMRGALPGEMGQEAASRAVVVGWTPFDDFAQLRDNFTQEDRTKVLDGLGLPAGEQLYFHATSNVLVDYDDAFFPYQKNLTEAVLSRAKEIGIRLMVRPHPREATESPTPEFTSELCDKYNHRFSREKADMKKILLSSDSFTSGRSTAVIEACLFDVNVAAILLNPSKADFDALPPVALDAVPYAASEDEITPLLYRITSQDIGVNEELREARKKFSVDGQASKRLANLVEETLAA